MIVTASTENISGFSSKKRRQVNSFISFVLEIFIVWCVSINS